MATNKKKKTAKKPATPKPRKQRTRKGPDPRAVALLVSKLQVTPEQAGKIGEGPNSYEGQEVRPQGQDTYF